MEAIIILQNLVKEAVDKTADAELLDLVYKLLSETF